VEGVNNVKLLFCAASWGHICNYSA